MNTTPYQRAPWLRTHSWAVLTAAAALLTGCGAAQAASGGSTPQAHTASSSVELGRVTVAGKSEKVLENSSGYTLYYFTKDTASKSACTGACAAIWHPLLTKSGSVSAPKGLSGTLAVVKDSHGSQVAYNGHLLYLYSGDHHSGEAKGQGILNEWWVATPSLSQLGSSSSTGNGGGYGY